MKILSIISETNDDGISSFLPKTYPTMFAELEHLTQLYDKAFLLVHDSSNPLSGISLIRRVIRLPGTKTVSPTDPETKPGYVKINPPCDYGYSSFWIVTTAPNVDKIIRQIKRAEQYVLMVKKLRARITNLKQEIQKSV